MSDTFPSGSNLSGGPSPETAERAGEVTGTLAELERKLRELERELTSIGRRASTEPAREAEPVRAAMPAREATPVREAEPARQTAAEAGLPATGGHLVDEALEPAGPSAVERPAAPQAPPERPQPVERPRPSDAQLASLAELRRFRDRLERFARELTAEYDALLGRVMAGLSSAPTRAVQASPTQTAPPRQAAAPELAGAPGLAGTPGPTAAPAQPAAPAPLIRQPAPPAAPAPATTLAAAAGYSPEDALFEGRVELGVGPFYDIGALGAFERRLASLPGVTEASVRRFEASHAVVDVRLAAPTALVRELRRTADADFNVREIASGRILLTFDDS
jgi:hypothetical protein